MSMAEKIPARRLTDDGNEPLVESVEVAHEEIDGEPVAVVRFSGEDGVIHIVRMTERAVLGSMAGSIHFLRQARRQLCAGCGLPGSKHPTHSCQTWH